ncbi:MAG: hypothetical protein J0653_02755, partial [Deltaproteobacteria bacterium]|nr:hypothetical protein [Deltaproteobacteria bacterium]
MSSSALRTPNRIQPYLPLIFIVILFGGLLLLAACSVWGGIDKQGGLLYFLTKWQAGLNREIAGQIKLLRSAATFFHAFGSVILVGGLYFFFGRYVPSVMNHLNDWLYIAAGILLALTGMQIFYAFHRAGPSSARTLTAQIHPLWIATGIGIVPCPLAAVIF